MVGYDHITQLHVHGNIMQMPLSRRELRHDRSRQSALSRRWPFCTPVRARLRGPPLRKSTPILLPYLKIEVNTYSYYGLKSPLTASDSIE